MEIYHERVSEIARYLRNVGEEDLRSPAKQRQYQNYLGMVRPYLTLNSESRLLEIGVGTGWFPILCALEGLRCKGLEISPDLVEYARAMGRRYGVEPDIELGNVEQSDIGEGIYDAIFSSSVFEHVEQWRLGLARKSTAPSSRAACSSLRPRTIQLHERRIQFPLYGWMPNAWRFRLRKTCRAPT